MRTFGTISLGSSSSCSLRLGRRLMSLVRWLAVLFVLLGAFSAAAKRCPRPTFSELPTGKLAASLAEHDDGDKITKLLAKKKWDVGDAWVADLEAGLRLVQWTRHKPAKNHFGHGALELGLLKKTGSTWALTKRVQVVSERFESEEGLESEALTLTDVDGDGKPEILINWVVTGESAPAVGSPSEYHAALYRLPDLKRVWGPERIAAAGAGGQDDCEGALRRADIDCDGRMELRLITDCQVAICVDYEAGEEPQLDCEPPTRSTQVWAFNAKKRTWISEGRADEAEDDKKYVVILGSFRMVSPRANTKGAQALAVATKAGIAAKLVPSYAFPGFACCFKTLVGGRFKDKKAAAAVLEKGKAAGLKGYVKRFGKRVPLREESSDSEED